MDNQPKWQKVDALMADLLDSLEAPSIGERSDEPSESHQTQESNSGYRLPDMPTAELSWDTPVAREREEELKKSYIDPIELSRVQDNYIGMTAHVVEWLQKECRNIGSAHSDTSGNTADLGGADVVTLCRLILGSNIKCPYGIRRHWECSMGYRTYHRGIKGFLMHYVLPIMSFFQRKTRKDKKSWKRRDSPGCC